MNDDSGVAGEAGRGADALEAMGFSNTEATNYDGDSGQTTNVVWYAEGRAETAAAVAAALGVSAEQTSQQPLANGDVVVVVKEALAIAE
nr:LytR C-terminal domain-containing protein [Isoptericola halotolerans]